jgi:hypothetical protein
MVQDTASWGRGRCGTPRTICWSGLTGIHGTAQHVKYGAGTTIRTQDLRITSALLYQLSYTGITCYLLLTTKPVSPLLNRY